MVAVTKAYREPDTDTIELGSAVQQTRYDGQGRRIVREVMNAGSLDRVEHYYYSGESVVEVRNGSDQLLKQNVWAGMFGTGYVDELIQTSLNEDPFASDGSEDEAEVHHWALHNANFNVMMLVDEDAEVVERYEYTPYGERQVYFSAGDNDPLAMSPTTQSRRWQVDGVEQSYGLNTIGHQGLMHDEHVGLIENRARTLNPTLGRFMQRDPLNHNQPGGGYQDGLSLYSYYAGFAAGLDPTGTSLYQAVHNAVPFPLRPGTWEVNAPIPGPAGAFCSAVGTLTVEQDTGCCLPAEITVGMSCSAPELLKRAVRVLRPRSIRNRADRWITRNVPDIISLQGHARAQFRVCPDDVRLDRLSGAASTTIGQGRRGGRMPNRPNRRLVLGAVIEVDFGYDFNHRSWDGTVDLSASAAFNFGSVVNLHRSVLCRWSLGHQATNSGCQL